MIPYFLCCINLNQVFATNKAKYEIGIVDRKLDTLILSSHFFL